MVSSTKGKLKVLKIVLWSILGVVLLFVFTVVGSLLVQKYIKKSSVPMFAGYGSFIVVTGSMSGTIEKGDMIIVKRTDEYTLGDIVTYVATNGEVVTHRLVNYGPKNGTFITKGDANPSTDLSPISVDQIVGEVVLTIPKIGLFFDWFLHDGGIIYAVSMIAIVIVGVYFWNRFNDDPKAEENAEANEEHLQDNS